MPEEAPVISMEAAASSWAIQVFQPWSPSQSLSLQGHDDSGAPSKAKLSRDNYVGLPDYAAHNSVLYKGSLAADGALTSVEDEGLPGGCDDFWSAGALSVLHGSGSCTALEADAVGTPPSAEAQSSQPPTALSPSQSLMRTNSWASDISSISTADSGASSLRSCLSFYDSASVCSTGPCPLAPRPASWAGSWPEVSITVTMGNPLFAPAPPATLSVKASAASLPFTPRHSGGFATAVDNPYFCSAAGEQVEDAARPSSGQRQKQPQLPGAPSAQSDADFGRPLRTAACSPAGPATPARPPPPPIGPLTPPRASPVALLRSSAVAQPARAQHFANKPSRRLSGPPPLGPGPASPSQQGGACPIGFSRAEFAPTTIPGRPPWRPTSASAGQTRTPAAAATAAAAGTAPRPMPAGHGASAAARQTRRPQGRDIRGDGNRFPAHVSMDRAVLAGGARVAAPTTSQATHPSFIRHGALSRHPHAASVSSQHPSSGDTGRPRGAAAPATPRDSPRTSVEWAGRPGFMRPTQASLAACSPRSSLSWPDKGSGGGGKGAADDAAEAASSGDDTRRRREIPKKHGAGGGTSVASRPRWR